MEEAKVADIESGHLRPGVVIINIAMKTYSTFLVALAGAFFITSASAQHKSNYSTYGPDQDAVQALEDQWMQATLKSDAGPLERILRDDYTVVSPDGETLTKGQEIAITSSDLKLESLTVQGSKVKIYIGSAVASGTMSLKGECKGKDVSGDYRYIDVYEPGKDGWKAVYRQLTKVKAEKPKKSEGSEK